jgi:hypothetical protein
LKLEQTQSNHPMVYPALAATACLVFFAVAREFTRFAGKIDGATILLAVCVSALIASLAWLLERRKLKAGLMLLILPAAIVFSGHVEALAALALFFIGTLSLGLRVMDLFGGKGEDAFQDSLVALGLGMGTNAFVVWALMHIPINVTPVYCAIFVAETALGWVPLKKWMKKALHSASKLRPTLAQKILFLWAAVVMLYSLVPDFIWDDMVAHLYVPHVVSLFGKFDFDPHYVRALDLAILPQSTYTSLYLLGGEFAVRLFNWGLIALSLFGIERFASQRLRSLASVLVTLSVAFTPFLLWTTAYVFIDSFNLFFGFLIILQLSKACELESMGEAALFVVLLFFAFIAKQTCVFVILPAALFFLGFRIGRSKEISLGLAVKGALLGGGVVAVPLMILLLHNWILSGNPVFPYYNSLFRSQYYMPWSFNGVFHIPLRLDSLYQLTFHGSRYIQIDDFAFGIVFLCFLPVVALTIPWVFRERTTRLSFFVHATILALGVVLWWKTTGTDMRYLTGLLFPASFLAGQSLDAMLSKVRHQSILRWAFAAVVGVSLATNFVFQFSIPTIPKPLPVIEAFVHRDPSRDGRITYFANVRRAFDYASLKYGKNSKGLILSGPFLYFADFHAEINEWYNYLRWQELSAIGDTATLADHIFRTDGFNFVIMSTNSENYKDKPAVLGLLKQLTTEFVSGDQAVLSRSSASGG